MSDVAGDYPGISVRFYGHFPGGPGLSGTGISPFWVLLELKDDGGGGNKAPVESSPPTNQHPAFLQTGCPSCRPTNSVEALEN